MSGGSVSGGSVSGVSSAKNQSSAMSSILGPVVRCVTPPGHTCGQPSTSHSVVGASQVQVEQRTSPSRVTSGGSSVQRLRARTSANASATGGKVSPSAVAPPAKGTRVSPVPCQAITGTGSPSQRLSRSGPALATTASMEPASQVQRIVIIAPLEWPAASTRSTQSWSRSARCVASRKSTSGWSTLSA